MARVIPDEPITFGEPRFFRPVCIRWPDWGFLGGPVGYERTDDPEAETRIVEGTVEGIEAWLNEGVADAEDCK